jgi:hypothetical protein
VAPSPIETELLPRRYRLFTVSGQNPRVARSHCLLASVAAPPAEAPPLPLGGFGLRLGSPKAVKSLRTSSLAPSAANSPLAQAGISLAQALKRLGFGDDDLGPRGVAGGGFLSGLPLRSKNRPRKLSNTRAARGENDGARSPRAPRLPSFSTPRGPQPSSSVSSGAQSSPETSETRNRARRCLRGAASSFLPSASSAAARAAKTLRLTRASARSAASVS